MIPARPRCKILSPTPLRFQMDLTFFSFFLFFCFFITLLFARIRHALNDTKHHAKQISRANYTAVLHLTLLRNTVIIAYHIKYNISVRTRAYIILTTTVYAGAARNTISARVYSASIVIIRSEIAGFAVI